MSGGRLTLEPGCWYGWTMWPGYLDEPYVSPIQVRSVRTFRDMSRRISLDFLNLGYAAGVQAMRYELQTLKREAAYILAAVVKSDRAVAIEPLTRCWMRRNLPRLLRDRQFDEHGLPVESELRKLSG